MLAISIFSGLGFIAGIAVAIMIWPYRRMKVIHVPVAGPTEFVTVSVPYGHATNKSKGKITIH